MKKQTNKQISFFKHYGKKKHEIIIVHIQNSDVEIEQQRNSTRRQRG